MGLEKFDSFVKTQLIKMVNGIYTDKDLITMMKKTVDRYEFNELQQRKRNKQ